MSRSEAERRAGLDRSLPPGERIVWQGKPSPRAMGAVVFRFRLVWAYLAILTLLATWSFADAGWPIQKAVALGILAIPAGLVGLGILVLLGMLMARTSTYTLTNRRIVMHIGVAYDRTISIPLSAVSDASIRLRGRNGLGDIAFVVKDTGGLGYINLWPHARPFRFAPAQPALRAVPHAAAVADMIGEALLQFNTAPAGPVAQVETPPMIEPERQLAGARA